MVFQFQYGTIKRKAGSTSLLLTSCFNSNMVRLKEINSKRSIIPDFVVSIPIWYD